MPQNMVPAGLTPEEVVAHVIAQQSACIAQQMDRLSPKPEATPSIPEAPKPEGETNG